jgi:hypothetical protein
MPGDSSGQWRQQNWKISKDQIAEALEYEAAEFVSMATSGKRGIGCQRNVS